ncbi:glycosyltransferase family 39 protein [bacterium]|nr:glycosyltransferase family 39 protein [bacterium]
MRAPALIFLIVLAAYALTAAGHLFSPDEEIVFRTTRALASGRGLAIEPLPSGEATRPANPPRADGREYAQYGIGQPILAMPLVWIGNGLARIGGDRAWQRLYGNQPFGPAQIGFAPTAAELAPRWACSWFNILLGAAMAVLVYFLCLEAIETPKYAVLAALLYALGSMAWPHSRAFFTEQLAAFCLMLSFYALARSLRGNRRLAWCLGAGVAAGYAFLARNDSVLAYPGLAVMMLGPIVSAARARGRSFWPAWIVFALPVICAGAAQLLLNKLHFGNVMASGYSDQPEGVKFSTPMIAGLYGLLFSAGKGMFFFSPALALSFFGWKHLAHCWRRRHAAIVWALALMIVSPLAIQATWQNWPGGWCWGPRHIFQIHAFLAVPIAASLAFSWNRGARIAVVVLFFIGAAVQLLGSAVNFNAFYLRFFRATNGAPGYVTMFDPPDQQYWSEYFQILWRQNPETQFHPLAIDPRTGQPAFVAPAPTQNSIYLPQQSVWAGYPALIRHGEVDLFWLRAAGIAP